MKTLFCIFFILVSVSNIYSFKYFLQDAMLEPDSVFQEKENNNFGYSIPDSVLQKFPFRNQNYINRFYPGVVSYFQDFYIHGGDSYETGFFLDGVKYNDLFTGGNSFFLNPNVFERIDFYNGFLPANLGHSSSGLFNYKLKTGGDKIEFDVEHLTDNISFSNDAFSTNKRLGAYFYGYNETNVSVGGPLYFDNVRFLVNANYLFMRDKNPQRYPGADNLLFYDHISSDSIIINLPEGIVPLNSFESFNLLSTFLFDFDEVKIKASGIYFNEDQFTERNHILEYLNPRAGLINKTGGIININIDHKINDNLAYSVNGNYYQKSDRTDDQYLGDNYWSYGDSVANANAGIVWGREGNQFGRYTLPSDKHIFNFSFRNVGYPGVDHQKSEQQRFSLTGNFKFTIYDHFFKIGGEIFKHKLRYWQLFNQVELAGKFALWRAEPMLSEGLTDEELRELIAALFGVNNLGYDPDGDVSNQGLNSAPSPLFYSFYLDDQFYLLDNLQLYAGLRFDYFDFDHKKFIDLEAPEKTIIFNTGELHENGLVGSDSFSKILPKFYIKYSPLNSFSCVVNYSQKLQAPPFANIYRGISSIAYELRSGFRPFIFSNIGDIKPVMSSEYEVSFIYESFKTVNASLVFYKKITKNQISLDLQETNRASPYGYYYYYENKKTTDIWGSELLIEYKKDGLHLLSNISYQNIQDQYYGKQFNTIRLNTFLTYNFYHLQNISTIFRALNLSVLFSYNSGHPYYLEFRGPDSPYSGTTPNVYQLDLKIEKGFSVFNNLGLNFYIYVINLLDTKNVYDVFPRTGSAEDDGYLGDPNRGGHLLETFGEQYGRLYNLRNKYNPNDGQQTFYGPPRQLGFGIKLNY